jgi:hypothetical protein
MIGTFTKMICKLREQHKERVRRDLREQRLRRAAREREQGWRDLFDHMDRVSGHAARTASRLTSQPVALTAREAATEANRLDIRVQNDEDSGARNARASSRTARIDPMRE